MNIDNIYFLVFSRQKCNIFLFELCKQSKLANSTYCSLNVFSQKQSPVSAYADLPTSHMIFSLCLLSSISKPLTDSYRTPLKVSCYNPGSIFFHPSGTFKLLSCSSASFSPQPIQLK